MDAVYYLKNFYDENKQQECIYIPQMQTTIYKNITDNRISYSKNSSIITNNEGEVVFNSKDNQVKGVFSGSIKKINIMESEVETILRNISQSEIAQQKVSSSINNLLRKK